MKTLKISYYIDFLILMSIFIIVWGAFVRITGSGAGCGESWPLCSNLLIPDQGFYEARKTWIEYIHRASSGIYGLLILILPFTVARNSINDNAINQVYNKQAKRVAWAVLFFTIVEALIGALLVKQGLVEYSQSIWRGVVISLHLCNTLALMATLVTLRYLVSTKKIISFAVVPKNLKLRIIFLAMGIILVAVLGAIAALSNTLFPSTNLVDSFQKDLSTSVHIFLNIRIFHPILALLLTASLYSFFSSLPAENIFLKRVSISLLCFHILFGAATLLSLSPVWMKLGHLLLANLLWIVFVLGVCFVGKKSSYS
jgi:cytochrome c oxidase assembly protein subunit 15